MSGVSRSVPFATRFWLRVQRTESCWLWTAKLNASGYGVLWSAGSASTRRQLLAHRVAWELSNGVVQDGLFVCHRCDNRRCCNPAHLFLGTNADNMADMKMKGRAVGHKGEANPRAKLTAADVSAIRQHLALGVRKTDLARRFGVSDVAIGHIANGRNWKTQEG